MITNFKIINDPVHGFINIPPGLISDIIAHPYFQRLRDIKQLGLTNLVYPGATHSRLSHALGAMHLMREAVSTLRIKNFEISAEEEEAAMSAMLLHDIGHGPFSHALENVIVGVSHEEISLALMEHMNLEFDGRLNMAISIFKGDYHKPFLHQLVSGQLDVDRLDYLKRDSFFSGVAEGMIGLERIIKMLTVYENSLAVEMKGLYSVEKFLISRRLMYWQVYLHKTVVGAEQLLISILKRARLLTGNGVELPGTPALIYFLGKEFTQESFKSRENLTLFTQLDDTDIMSAIKQWQRSKDTILSSLCRMLTERRLPKMQMSSTPADDNYRQAISKFGGTAQDASYFICKGELLNKGYDSKAGEILVISKDGVAGDVYDASDMLSAKAFSEITKKYFLCIAEPTQENKCL